MARIAINIAIAQIAIALNGDARYNPYQKTPPLNRRRNRVVNILRTIIYEFIFIVQAICIENNLQEYYHLSF